MVDENRATGNQGTATFIIVLIVVAALYFARSIFIPLALAILLAFLLAPLTIRLRHFGLARVPAAVLVVFLAFIVLGVLSSFMASQLADVAHKLPGYQQNMHRKLDSLRASGGGVVSRITRAAREVQDTLTPPPPPPSHNQPAQERPVPVEIRRSAFSPLDLVQKVLGSLLSGVLTAAIVIVFVIFILIERETLRDRLIRLGGAGRVNLTTEVLDDAAHRVSRYLLAQLVINVGYGSLAGIALYFMGVPNPVLWAIVAALLRYIPYLGIWIAAFMPAAVVFAVASGWAKVPLVFGVYFGIDLLMYNFVEPLLYGTSTGISPLAILVAAVFWTWLWGPVGLLLATPLTVCVVVIGRHVPRLRFLEVLLGDEPVLAPATRFYQRLLAMDLEEATEICEEFLKEKPVAALYDEVIVPALSLAEEDRHRNRIDPPRERFVFEHARLLIEEIGERPDEPHHEPAGTPAPEPNSAPSPLPGTVLCIASRDDADELAGLMLVQMLVRSGISAKLVSSEALAGESTEQAVREHPDVACVVTVPPFGYVHARYLCRRLRSQLQDLKLVGAILTERDPAELKERQPSLPADELVSSLAQAVERIRSWLVHGVQLAPQPLARAS